MKFNTKHLYVCTIAALFGGLLMGCSGQSIEPTVPVITTQAPTTEAETTTEKETEPETTTIEETTAEETTVAETTAAPGKMEQNPEVYENNNISIAYPQIAGMTDKETQEWANAQLKEDALSIVEVYGLDETKDTLSVTYETSILYKGEISLIYSGYYQKGTASTQYAIKISEGLNLTEKKVVRLQDRLAAAKIVKAITQTGDFTILSKNADEETVKSYLKTLDEKFFTDLVAKADFGGTETPTSFSYDYLSSVVMIIPVPHILGDYIELSIVQQTK